MLQCSEKWLSSFELRAHCSTASSVHQRRLFTHPPCTPFLSWHFALLSQSHLQRRFANPLDIGDGCFCAPIDDMPPRSLSQSKGLLGHYDNPDTLHFRILQDLYYYYCAAFYGALSDLCFYASLASRYHLCFAASEVYCALPLEDCHFLPTLFTN